MVKIKKYFFILLLLEMAFAYAPAYSATVDYRTFHVQDQIKQWLCVPSDVKPSETNVTGTGNNFQTTQLQQYANENNANKYDLYNCINQLYKFSIVLASVVGVFFLVIAGYLYMSAEGNAETVDKAKSIMVSTITSLFILFIGFLLLKAINPDLVQFQTIQPCSVADCSLPTGSPTGGGPAGVPVTGPNISGTCYTNSCIINGFNISSYATAPNHESTVANSYNSLQNEDFSSAASVDRVLKHIAATTPLTGSMILSAASSFNIDPRLLVALVKMDSTLGTQGVGARCMNPGNVIYANQAGAVRCVPPSSDGNYDIQYNSWQEGVNAVASWLNRHRG